MKLIMIAALAAAQLSAAARPAQAAEQPREEAAFREAPGVNVEQGQAYADPRAAAAQDEEPRKKKRKSTGDKVLTGAAVVLGVGALAVGGLLVAIFVG